jgi:hypothetical protein
MKDLIPDSGHYPPRPAENAPEYEILDVNVQGEFYDISIVCYSCDQWNGHAINVHSEAQAMIYSIQVHVKMQTTDKAAPLSLHTDYSTLKLYI